MADVNIADNVALCRKCGQLNRASDLIDRSFDPDAIRTPPPGAWMQPTMDGVTFGATTRSAAAFLLVPFMLIWSGGSLGTIYGPQIKSGEFNLLLSLFGLPFLAGSIFFWAITLMALFGKVEVRLRGRRGQVLVGIGNFGWKRQIDLTTVTSITEETRLTRRRHGTGTSTKIVLRGPHPVEFGSGLRADRRAFILHSLRAAQI